MRFPSIILAYLLLLPALSLPVFSQDPLQTRPTQRLPNQFPPAPDETRQRLEKEMAKKANQERQAQLKRDTEQLLKLAAELKQYVDKSNEHTLSVNVIKKAEEIEKLARSVKEKMRGE